MTGLSQAHLAWFEKRKICPEVVAKLGVHSGSRVDEQVLPNSQGSVIIFPYFERGECVAEKYRGPNKQFSQRKGGKKTFYNADVLDDPALHDGRSPLLIVEGEPDTAAAITAGHPFTVSVPDGTTPVPEGLEPEDVPEPTADEARTGKFAFLWNNRERLSKIRRFVIATDSDPPGRRMAALLVKHLGAARCARLEYPEGCKDPNDITMRFGGAELMRRIASAKDYPVRGIYELTDFNEEETKLYSIGIDGWGTKLKLFEGAFVVVTGPTNHGKTSWAMEVAANMARDHNWRVAVFSPEQRPTEIRNLVRTLYCGGAWTRDLVDRADSWIRKHFKLILGDPLGAGDRDDDITLQWLLDRAESAVLRHDIHMLIIDPWNELEHARDRNESVTDYTGRAIRQIKRFARQYNVLVMLCVHPTKDFTKGTTNGKPRHVTLYDCEGSAHWANKADIGIVVERDEEIQNGAKVTVAKLRYKKYGTCGSYAMQFDTKTQRYRAME